jgi:mannose-1-phosphate guanylyltransferase
MVFIIMAGGSGTRFWPLSRRSYPKQFLSIVSNRPMIEETFLRISSLSKNIFIVANSEHRNIIEGIFKDNNIEILSEPFGRNTAPCVGLAAINVKNRFGDVPMVILPADHFVANEKLFIEQLNAGVEIAKNGGIVTIGIKPNRPETGYGYIMRSRKEEIFMGHKLYLTEKFIEKPSLDKAIEYINSGEYLWNSGIFIFRVSVILNEIKKYLKRLYDGLMELEKVIGKDEYPYVLEKVYRNIESISIDYGVMEKTEEKVYVIEGDFVWDDVGSWEALYRLRKDDHDINGNIMEGKGVIMDSNNIFIHSYSNRVIAALGLRDILIVDDKDALLVADIKRSQEIKNIVDRLREKGLEEVL